MLTISTFINLKWITLITSLQSVYKALTDNPSNSAKVRNMQTLVIYELIPEGTRFFLVDGEDTEWLTVAHGCVMNVHDLTSEQEAVHVKFSDHIAKKPEYASDKNVAGKWLQYELPRQEPGSLPIEYVDRVIWLGFLL